MIALMLTFTLLVDIEARNVACGAREACYNVATNTVFMRDYYDLAEGQYVVTIPEDMTFPSFNPRYTREHWWRRCGWALQDASDMERSGYAAEILCHEAKHAYMQATGGESWHHRTGEGHVTAR